ncbi:MAG: RCC1 domain-containing protein [Candidatus Saccharimonadaceae bacterium]|nr:RCC1 domain-containing protein [Candidatus Saccharimonadaceae bacterium]
MISIQFGFIGIDSGQLGNNSYDSSLVPVAVDTSGVLDGLTMKAITAGWGFTCSIASDNLAYCWGSNYAGQLGQINGPYDTSAPLVVDTSVPVSYGSIGNMRGKTFKSIDSGEFVTCVIASDNHVYCWANFSGGL